MEEFNKKFRDIIASMDNDFKPPDKSILVYYIEALSGEMRYQLRDKEPVDLKVSQALALKLMQTCRLQVSLTCLVLQEGR